MSQKGYRCYHPPTKRIFVSRHVLFNEQVFPFKTIVSPSNINSANSSSDTYSLWALPSDFPSPAASNSSSANGPDNMLSPIGPFHPPSGPTNGHAAGSDLAGSPAHPLQRSSNSNSSDRSTDRVSPAPVHPTIPTHSNPTISASSHPMTTRNKDNTRRSRTFPDFIAYLATTPANVDPTTFAQAQKVPHWQDAMSTEIQALLHNKTWVLVPQPADQHIVGCKWVYKTKRCADGSIDLRIGVFPVTQLFK